VSRSTTMTIRLEPEIKSRLEKLSTAMKRSRSWLAAEAVREFVELNEWQIREIEEAIKEADAGDYASNEDVSRLFDHWDSRGT